MSSAIILPIFYDRQMRGSNRRELFVKRFTSGCVVIATLFIVVGLSSATWYMTILGTFILMIVGLSGFCLKYCDRTSDVRAVRRGIAISSQVSSTRRARHPVNLGRSCPAEVDLPPAYDNIVFDEPYSLGTVSCHIRTFENSPPPPYEAIFNDVNQSTTEHSVNPDSSLPDYSSIPPRSRSVPATLVVPRFSMNRYDGQSVCLSHAIGVTITTSSQSNQMASETLTSETSCTVVSRVSTGQTVAPLEARQIIAQEASQSAIRQTPQLTAPETHQTVAQEAFTRQQAPRPISPATCRAVAPETQERVAQETSQTVAQHVNEDSAYEQLNCTQSVTITCSENRSVQCLNEEIENINNGASVTSENDSVELTNDSSGASNVHLNSP